MTISPTPLFNAVVLGTAVALLAGCGMNMQEKTEVIATSLQSMPGMQGRLIAYTNFSYRSGKSTAESTATTLVADLEGCKLHGQYQVMDSQLHDGNPVKLSCLGLDGSVKAQFTCRVQGNAPACTNIADISPGDRNGRQGVKYPNILN